MMRNWTDARIPFFLALALLIGACYVVYGIDDPDECVGYDYESNIACMQKKQNDRQSDGSLDH